MRTLLACTLLALFLTQCQKPNTPDCIQPRGEIMEFPIELNDNITHILIQDDVKVILQNTSENQSSFLRCHEYLESDIVLETIGNQLIISNKNSCNWVRKKAEITLYIYSDSITHIENRGTNGAELMEYTTTKFEFNQWESLATNHLDVNSDSLIVNMHVLNGSAEISGYSTYAQLYANGVTSITNKGFTCQTAFVNNSSLKDIYVSAQDYMFAFIGNEGNIFYNQENVDLKINIQGQGVVIFADF